MMTNENLVVFEEAVKAELEKNPITEAMTEAEKQKHFSLALQKALQKTNPDAALTDDDLEDVTGGGYGCAKVGNEIGQERVNALARRYGIVSLDHSALF